MNLTGHWKGKYTYTSGYSRQMIGRSEPFEFTIDDNNGAISGTCIDEIVKAKEGNESYIVGTFKENRITFKKRYKFHLTQDESGAYYFGDGEESNGVDYIGKLHKKFFSGRVYFSGKWNITGKFKDENDLMQNFILEGTWKMTRVR